MNSFKEGDKVYIKSTYEKTKFKSYKIHCLNKNYAILEVKSESQLYKKIPLEFLSKNIEDSISTETINKGDLVKCIINNSLIKEGVDCMDKV